MDKWEKTVLLHRLLSRNKYSIPINTILKELNCHQATFHRVRNFMKAVLGAPIVFDLKYKGYRYETTDGHPFELPGFWFTKEEIEAFLCLDHAVESIHEEFFRELLEPVRKRFEPMLKAQKTNIESIRERIKILSMSSRECNKEIFRTIASAAIARRKLFIRHRNLTKNEAQERIISPQALVRYRDNWYVDAFCHLRNEPRSFAIDRIEFTDFALGKFHMIPQDQMNSFYSESYGIFNGPATKLAVIEFTGIAAREVSREQWHPKQQCRWIDEKTYRLNIPYGHSRELIMDILRWGDEAEVIEPNELREALFNTIIRMQKKYENNPSRKICE